jgi:hypothetical protein
MSGKSALHHGAEDAEKPHVTLLQQIIKLK